MDEQDPAPSEHPPSHLGHATTHDERTSRADAAWFWPGLGIGTSAVTLLVGYLVLRFSPSPVEVALGVVGALLVVLAVLGFLATKRGQAPVFVAIALLMPYLLFGVVTYGGAQRAADEVGSYFDEEYGEDDFSDEFLEEEGDGTYGSDPELDALQDQCVDGDDSACSELYDQSPSGSEYESTAEEYLAD